MKIYVAGNVSRSGDGSLDHPFMTISEAAEKARPGDTRINAGYAWIIVGFGIMMGVAVIVVVLAGIRLT